MVFQNTELLDKDEVAVALTEAADTVLSLTVVHLCEYTDDRHFHPLILGHGEPLSLPSHIVQAERKGDLYLGDSDAAASWFVLKELHITAVVNASQGPNQFPDHLTYFSVDVADSPEEDLLSHVDEVVRFLDEILSKGKNVLVHCHMGVSRSASLVIAWLVVASAGQKFNAQGSRKAFGFEILDLTSLSVNCITSVWYAEHFELW